MSFEHLICKNCRYYDSTTTGKPTYGPTFVGSVERKNGFCRRQPPQVFNDNHYGYWPLVHEQDWCGEFVPTSVAKEAL